MMFETSGSGVDSSTATIEDYLAAITKRVPTVLAGALLGLVAAWLITGSRTPVFSAESTVLVNPTPVASATGNLVQPNLDREVEVIVSDVVAETVAEELGDVTPSQLRRNVTAEFVPDSDIIKITYESDDAQFSAATSNAFANEYVSQRVSAQVAHYADQLDELDVAMTERSASLEALASEIASIDRQRSTILEDEELLQSERQVLLENLATQRQVAVTESNQLASLIRTDSTLRQSLFSASRTQAPSAAVIAEALVPETPVGVPNTLILIAGAVLGLALGVVAAFLAERLDRSANEPEEVRTAMGAPVLAAVPSFGWRNRKGPAALVMASSGSSKDHEAREAYRRLRTAVMVLAQTDGYRSVLVTSSTPGEGKSVTSANLAAAVASGGHTVALINADMRRPTLELLFGAENHSDGLSAYLGRTTDDLHVDKFDLFPELAFVPAGPVPANPGELLGSPIFSSLISSLSEQVDLVIVDTPPVGATADAGAAAKAVDAVIVVVDAKATTTEDLKVTRADLDRAGAKVAGTVINRSAPNRRLFRRGSRYAYATPN